MSKSNVSYLITVFNAVLNTYIRPPVIKTKKYKKFRNRSKTCLNLKMTFAFISK